MVDRPPLRRQIAGAVAALLLPMTAAACLPDTRGSGGPVAVGSESATPTATPLPLPSGPTPSPSFVRPTPTPMPTFLVVTVKAGESLNTIAHRYGTTARSIAFWNRTTYPSLDPLSPKYRPNLLQVGWTLLVIPNVTFDEESLPEPS
jgi:LysM domain